MPKVRLQFHASASELVELAERWAEECGCTLVVERFFPAYRADLADRTGPLVGDRPDRTVDRLALTDVPPDLSATSAHDFAVKNPRALFLLVGLRSDEGLRESALGGMTEDIALAKIWRRVVRAAKTHMHRGATVSNPQTGAAARAPDHLHTPGAHTLAADGVRMLAIAGWNEFKFDDLEGG